MRVGFHAWALATCIVDRQAGNFSHPQNRVPSFPEVLITIRVPIPQLGQVGVQ
jgi:hypothetical protein